MSFWAAIKREIKRARCRHWNARHEGPRLIDDEKGMRVVSRYYCEDCGKGLENPWRDYDHEIAVKMLYEARRKKGLHPG